MEICQVVKVHKWLVFASMPSMHALRFHIYIQSVTSSIKSLTPGAKQIYDVL